MAFRSVIDSLGLSFGCWQSSNISSSFSSPLCIQRLSGGQLLRTAPIQHHKPWENTTLPLAESEDEKLDAHESKTHLEVMTLSSWIRAMWPEQHWVNLDKTLTARAYLLAQVHTKWLYLSQTFCTPFPFLATWKQVTLEYSHTTCLLHFHRDHTWDSQGYAWLQNDNLHGRHCRLFMPICLLCLCYLPWDDRLRINRP